MTVPNTSAQTQGKSYYDASFYDAATITKSDSTIIPATRAVFVGGTGNLNVVLISGNTVLFTAVPANTILWIAAIQILSASTTTTNMVALY